MAEGTAVRWGSRYPSQALCALGHCHVFRVRAFRQRGFRFDLPSVRFVPLALLTCGPIRFAPLAFSFLGFYSTRRRMVPVVTVQYLSLHELRLLES